MSFPHQTVCEYRFWPSNSAVRDRSKRDQPKTSRKSVFIDSEKASESVEAGRLRKAMKCRRPYIGLSSDASLSAGALQLLMGSASRSMAPFTLAFHGTSPANVPSILKNGMLPKKRLAGGDWFAPLPFKSLSYCQKPWGKGAVLKGPPYRLILFLLLPVARVDL